MTQDIHSQGEAAPAQDFIDSEIHAEGENAVVQNAAAEADIDSEDAGAEAVEAAEVLPNGFVELGLAPELVHAV